MPRKVRQLIADLEQAGFVTRGGDRNLTHVRKLAAQFNVSPELFI